MRYLLFSVLLLVQFPLFGQIYSGKVNKSLPSPEKGANCAPANFSTISEYNNVRELVHTGGNLWQVKGQNLSLYEVPKNSGIMCFFTSALWLGGTDVNGQLKLAALRYKDGSDYWTGPLTNLSASIDPSECSKYDTHFTSSQDKVRQFNAWFMTGEQDAINGTTLQQDNFPNYAIPEFIKTWPAHGDVSQGQDYYLAPFFDYDNDGNYNWEKGDYPWYDLNRTKDCKTDRRVSLFGDFNLWWVMNDKGNIHTESGGDPIGMEIRAQSFSFATNDDVNNMTFLNYELINRSTQTLYNTYFGVFVDGALGDPFDDFVGSDVSRGLGYFYNGDAVDADNNGFKGYGSNPPAAGVDFFEGPYQDDDLLDNAYGIGQDEALNGIGYGDGVVDNERYGMRRFLYYVNTGGGSNPSQTDPTSASDYYNFLRGRWKDNTPFYYGGNGHISDPEANITVPCDFMFPGDTDPLGWGTGGVPQPLWTEQTANNQPYDRRFLQSAGPFVLKPGAVNNITVGMVWGRGTGGDPFESVKALQRADDKAQALFENCFRVLEGPNAPSVVAQELDREVILMLSNSAPSNNVNEQYSEFDPFISTSVPNADKNYRFQGYQVFQVSGKNISVSNLEDPTKARLVAQCDIKDNVSRIVNFEFDDDLQASIPVEKVNGENKGIRHSFRFTEDMFANGNRRLINFKRYYYIAISYAYNNYDTYDPTDPVALFGQKKPYLSSRKAPIGEVKVVEVIPHNPIAEGNGTEFFAQYGFQPEITRIDGRGNGANILDFTRATEEQIIQTGFSAKPTYQKNGGPIRVKVIDPLTVSGGYFTCTFSNLGANPLDSASWVIHKYTEENGTLLDSVTSEQTIAFDNEQLIPKWGISVQIKNEPYYSVGIPAPEYRLFAEPLTSSISFADSSKQWLSFVQDDASFTPLNWIRSGVYEPTAGDNNPALGYNNPALYPDKLKIDPALKYAKLLGGGVTHFSLVGYQSQFMPLTLPSFYTNYNSTIAQATIARASSVDIVLTNDKSKWTRCAVLEMGREAALNYGNAEGGTLRNAASVDKNGQPDNSGTTGMGWFPGYAIDMETGARLHMAFGENSFFGASNGNDMVWNPTADLFDANGVPILGGQHPIYVFGVNVYNSGCPAYDGTNNWVADQFRTATNNSFRNAYYNCMWVVNPLLKKGQKFLSTPVRLRIRINKEYENFVASNDNAGLPKYGWSMDAYETNRSSSVALLSDLDKINVVPNPYYAYSEYERNKVDNRIKIINLPERCTVTIYNTSGKLINQFKKDSPQTFLDWTLANQTGIPVASGIYIIHVDVPGTGEAIRKVFLGMRLVDLEGF